MAILINLLPKKICGYCKIDSNIGYIRGNVHVVSYRANRIKGDATADELKLLSKNLKKLEMENCPQVEAPILH